MKTSRKKYQIKNNLTTGRSKLQFKLIYLPITIIIIFTALLLSIYNNPAVTIDTLYIFLIQTYIPVVILSWITFMVLILVINLRKRLKGIKITKF